MRHQTLCRASGRRRRLSQAVIRRRSGMLRCGPHSGRSRRVQNQKCVVATPTGLCCLTDFGIATRGYAYPTSQCATGIARAGTGYVVKKMRSGRDLWRHPLPWESAWLLLGSLDLAAPACFERSARQALKDGLRDHLPCPQACSRQAHTSQTASVHPRCSRNAGGPWHDKIPILGV